MKWIGLTRIGVAWIAVNRHNINFANHPVTLKSFLPALVFFFFITYYLLLPYRIVVFRVLYCSSRAYLRLESHLVYVLNLSLPNTPDPRKVSVCVSVCLHVSACVRVWLVRVCGVCCVSVCLCVCVPVCLCACVSVRCLCICLISCCMKA